MKFCIAYENDALRPFADLLAKRLGLPLDNHYENRLCLTQEGLVLVVSPFLPMSANFCRAKWQQRHDAGKKQGLIRACKPKKGLRIIDATAGWGRDAAILASFGADVLMLERHPLMAVLLDDALARSRVQDGAAALPLHCQAVNALDYLNGLGKEAYPHVIYLDPMHPERQKTALVKKPLQILQQLLGADEDALLLLQLARTRCLERVVLKWPAHLRPLLPPSSSVPGKTVRFDIYDPLAS